MANDLDPRTADAEDILRAIAAIAAGYALDENLGDTTERAETILFLASRGMAGRHWGHS